MDKDTKTSPDKNDQKNTDDETKLQTLRSLIQEGIDSGEVMSTAMMSLWKKWMMSWASEF